MDLTEALQLAKAGEKVQAKYEDSAAPARPTSSRERAHVDQPVKVPEPPDLKLTRQEWYGHVSNVARGLAELLGRPHWYDLNQAEREDLLELAGHALVAVASADVALRQRRLADKFDPIPESDPVDTAEREAAAGLDVRGEAEGAAMRKAQIERLKRLAAERAA